MEGVSVNAPSSTPPSAPATAPQSAPACPALAPSDVGSLLSLFAKTPYDSRETVVKTQQVLARCLELIELDYKCLMIPNSNGELCSSYPNLLIIPESERSPREDEAPTAGASNTLPSASTATHPLPPAPPAPPAHPCPLTLASPSPLFPPPSFSSVVVRGVGGGGGGGGGSGGGSLVVAAASEPQTDNYKLRDLILKAKFARCRARFPVPVILYKGNYICRSSTLAGGPEMYGRSGIEYLLTAAISGKAEEEVEDEEAGPPSTSTTVSTASTNSSSSSSGGGSGGGSGGEWQLFDKVRSQDIRLLRACSVGVIVDLMVEKKKVKYGLNVTSSEKVDKENRYSEFSILSLPYPGCEFFREFRDSGYTADGMTINWNHTFMDAHLIIPERSHARRVATDWHSYRKWDLVRLTQNYLRLLLLYAQEGSEGLLVHCISGWDRTPLFISLLRLSLWADGLIHPSLGPLEILYLTIAYDWLLFGHDLKDRLAKGEEIFFFCFDFLKYITTEEFSLDKRRHPSSDSSGGGGSTSGSTSGVTNNNINTGAGGILLLEGDGLSPAGSSTSLTSSCSSNRSSSHPPRYFRAESGLIASSHLTWPYGSDTSDLDLDDFSPRLSRASSASSSKGGLGTSTSRGTRDMDVDVGRQTASWSRDKRNLSESSESSGHGAGSEDKVALDDLPRASTSPVAVPVPRYRVNQPSQRQRNESLSSVGSWQIISTTGSLKGSAGLSAGSSTGVGVGSSAVANAGVTPHGSAGSRASMSSCLSVGSELVDSACTIKEEGSYRSGSIAETDGQVLQSSKRPERLAKVRSLFYNQYVTSIGFSACNGRHDSGLGTLVSNFAQKVGIRPSPNRGT